MHMGTMMLGRLARLKTLARRCNVRASFIGKYFSILNDAHADLVGAAF